LAKEAESVASQAEFGNFITIPIDSYFPKYLVDNVEKYSHIISENVADCSAKNIIDELI
jgi:hypothetical protein